MNVVLLWALSGCQCGSDPLEREDAGTSDGDEQPIPIRPELPSHLQRLVDAHPEAGWWFDGNAATLDDRALYSDVHLVCRDCPDTCGSIHLGPHAIDGAPLVDVPAESALTVSFAPAASIVDAHVEQLWAETPVAVVYWPEEWSVHAVTVDGEPVDYVRDAHDLLVPGPGRITVTGGGPALETMQVDDDQVLLPAWTLPGTGRAPTRITVAPVEGMTWVTPVDRLVAARARDVLIARPRRSFAQQSGPFRIYKSPVFMRDYFRERIRADDALATLRAAGVSTETVEVHFWEGGPSFAYADGIVLAPWILSYPHLVLHELGHRAFRAEHPHPESPDATLGEAAPTWLAIRDDRVAREFERSRAVEPGCYGLRSLPKDYAKHSSGGSLLLDMLAARIGREVLQDHLFEVPGWEDLASRLDPDDAAWLEAWLSAPAWPRPEVVDGVLVDHADTGLPGEVEIRWDTGQTQRVALGVTLSPPPGATTAEVDPEIRFLSASP